MPPEAIGVNIQGYHLNHYGNPQEAEKVFLYCIKRYPQFEWPYSNMAGICLDQQRYAEAESFGLKAIEINPLYVNALVNLAVTNGVQVKLVQARQYLDRALAADPIDPGAIQYNETLTYLEKRAAS